MTDQSVASIENVPHEGRPVDYYTDQTDEHKTDAQYFKNYLLKKFYLNDRRHPGRQNRPGGIQHKYLLIN